MPTTAAACRSIETARKLRPVQVRYRTQDSAENHQSDGAGYEQVGAHTHACEFKDRTIDAEQRPVGIACCAHRDRIAEHTDQRIGKEDADTEGHQDRVLVGALDRPGLDRFEEDLGDHHPKHEGERRPTTAS